MPKIAHLADVHIRGLSRHDEIRDVFSSFVNDARSQGVDHIFIGGDIFHTKCSGITPEYIELLIWLLSSLTQVADVHMILGNHDGVLTNLSRQDAISPIIAAINSPKVHLYKKSGVYQFAPGYNWCVFSLFDTDGWSEIKPTPNEVNIACYHGPVFGALTESNWEVKEGLKIDDFRQYDFCLLGDIHKFQFLDFRTTSNGSKKGWIGYPGSTLQNNYAESLDHGYLLWSITNRNDFDVEFKKLPNPKPYITIDWDKNVKTTISKARDLQQLARVRVRHKEELHHKDVVTLTSTLKQEFNVTEVTFKSDQQVNRQTVSLSSGSSSILKEDLRNPDILLHLIQNHYSEVTNFNDIEWQKINDLLKNYVSKIDDDTMRNTVWSLRHLKFDNVFCYGEDNSINFDKLSGVVGIFGMNRSGKSSIPGTIMYTLFNTTDRGSIKNLHVCNTRKQYCYARAMLNISGVDYVIERSTTKNEQKKGTINASTSLNFYKVNGTQENNPIIEDQTGEQRADTDKLLRKYFGVADDIAVTSMSMQGDISKIIGLGSAKRNQLLSRFLDLDVLYKIHVLARDDVNGMKTALKQLPDKDWNLLAKEKGLLINDCDAKIEQLNLELSEFHEQLNSKRNSLHKYDDVIPVTNLQVQQQKSRVIALEKQVDESKKKFSANIEQIKDLNQKLQETDLLLAQYDLADLRSRADSLTKLEASVDTLHHAHAKEETIYKQQVRSLKILDDVPCGDSFPTCKFIKDAHQVKNKIESQENKLKVASDALQQAKSSLLELMKENISEKLKKANELSGKRPKLFEDISNVQLENVKLETSIQTLVVNLESTKKRLIELEEALRNNENIEIVTLRNEIDSLQEKIESADRAKLKLASLRGHEVAVIESLADERNKRNEALQKMKVHELIMNAFSKKAIPSIILASQLPLINAEISRILNGIVDFSIELEHEAESDDLEIYINYGDSRRIIELGSGMEKTISSIAIRVALSNISTLPKTDMFIIDEGFGTLDPSGIESCSRLVQSLKKYFRLVLVISHVDEIKDSVDQILEITKVEKDSKIVYD